MDSRHVNLDSFIEYAKKINDSELFTKKQNKKFLFEIGSTGFYYLPSSTKKQRFQRFIYVKRFIDRYNETRSLNPKDYQDISVNASYLLVIIQNFLDDD